MYRESITFRFSFTIEKGSIFFFLFLYDLLYKNRTYAIGVLHLKGKNYKWKDCFLVSNV